MRAGISKPAGLAIALAVGLLIAVSATLFTESGTGTSPEIRTTTSSPPSSSSSLTNSSASNSTGTATVSCGLGVQTIAVNSTDYCADDISNDTILGGESYSYFRNGSVSFMGVTFSTVCPLTYLGCPGYNSTVATTMFAGAMIFTMTFPDNTIVRESGIIGDDTYIPILSVQSNPKAGMLIEITESAHSSTDRVFLLVEAPVAGMSANIVVATVTVTTTLTTQASQATTFYVLPSGCSYYPLTTTVTSTTTVGSGVPVSTSTTTVTTTSTTYSQTVTETSCTHGLNPTVTSTVTTTATP